MSLPLKRALLAGGIGLLFFIWNPNFELGDFFSPTRVYEKASHRFTYSDPDALVYLAMYAVLAGAIAGYVVSLLKKNNKK